MTQDYTPPSEAESATDEGIEDDTPPPYMDDDDYYQDIADRVREEIRHSERTRIAQGRKWENCID